MDIKIIGAPIFYGCDNPGCELGPDKIRELGVENLLKELGYIVNDIGNLEFENIEDKDKFCESSNMKYIKPILELNEKLAREVEEALNKDEIALVLGGDHSIALGSIAGASSATTCEKLGVIWLDAHGDINTPETSSSKNVHGMPLSASMNVGPEKLRNLYKDGMKVHPSNVFHFGGRDLDKGELDLIENIDSNFYTTTTLRQRGIDLCLEEMISKIKDRNLDKIHLSFDIDFIDSDYVPGTGTRVKEGFTVEETKYMLSKICSLKNIKSIDIVELNPRLDKEDITGKIAIEIIESIFSSLKKNK